MVMFEAPERMLPLDLAARIHKNKTLESKEENKGFLTFTNDFSCCLSMGIGNRSVLNAGRNGLSHNYYEDR